MFKSTLIILFLSLFIASCANNALVPGEENGDGATKLGSLGEDIPEPADEAKAMVERYLSEHPYWKGSYSLDEDPIDKNLLVEFDTENGTISILSLEDNSVNAIEFEINALGQLVTDNAAGGFDISLSIRKDSEIYPLDMNVEKTLQGYSARMFASNIDDSDYIQKYSNRTEMCMAEGTKCYKSDADLVGDGAFFVGGFMTLADNAGKECSMTVFDNCAEEGVALNEYVCDGESSLGYAIKKVECDCHNGKCLDEVKDEAMPFEFSVEKVCDGDLTYCSFFDATVQMVKDRPRSPVSPF